MQNYQPHIPTSESPVDSTILNKVLEREDTFVHQFLDLYTKLEIQIDLTVEEIRKRYRELASKEYLFHFLSPYEGGNPDDYSSTILITGLIENNLKESFLILFKGTSLEKLVSEIKLSTIKKGADETQTRAKNCSALALKFFDFICGGILCSNKAISAVEGLIAIGIKDRVNYHPDSHPLVENFNVREQISIEILKLFSRKAMGEVSSYGTLLNQVADPIADMNHLLEYIKGNPKYNQFYSSCKQYEKYLYRQISECHFLGVKIPLFSPEYIYDIYEALLDMSNDPELDELEELLEWLKYQCKKIIDLKDLSIKQVRQILTPSEGNGWPKYFESVVDLAENEDSIVKDFAREIDWLLSNEKES